MQSQVLLQFCIDTAGGGVIPFIRFSILKKILTVKIKKLMSFIITIQNIIVLTLKENDLNLLVIQVIIKPAII